MTNQRSPLCGVYALCFWFLCGSASASPLDAIIDPINPEISKWASVFIVKEQAEAVTFDWEHYKQSQEAVDFWPASTIKLYTVLAGLEYLNELGMPTDSSLSFYRQVDDRWRLDTARTMREMISEVFRRSSNEDYTLLLRFLGIDRMNTQFLIPQRGFPRSALMRDYVTYRPIVYENEEPQKILIMSSSGDRMASVEHTWTGISYAEKRGATVLSSTTGNCTSTYELANCVRRLMWHETIPVEERFKLTPEQIDFVRHGGQGLVGFENRLAGAYGWEDSGEAVFPKARFYHKAGLISTYSLDAAYYDDADSGLKFGLAVAAHSGDPTTVKEMAKAICQWIKDKQQ